MELYDFEADWVVETEASVCLEIDGNDIWFPKYVLQENDDGTYTVPRDWAQEKGLI